MKKYQKICLLCMILFCIDYSVTTLLGFNILYGRIRDLDVWHSLYAFVIGICGFISILLFQKEE